MGELRTVIHQRLHDAYESIRAARVDGDDFLIDARRAEIEDLQRIASDHGIEIPRGD